MAETRPPKTITIDPVTRIEGHAKITLHLGENGRVEEARFHVTEFRGFEKFCEGRSFREMPAITSRVCGICPVSHLLCSAKTGDSLLSVEIPQAAVLLRRVMNLAQILQSHALSFFHLSGPDLYLGFESDPANRNVFGLIRERPNVARDGIRLRQIGQQIIEKLGGRRIHSAWAAPGGITHPLVPQDRDAILAWLPEALEIATRTLGDFKSGLDRFADEIASFGSFPSLFLGLVTPEGGLEHYDGKIRVADSKRKIIADQLDPSRYEEFLAEKVEPWSYLKSPYYRSLGYPAGIYRVGPLARLNIADRCGTPRADVELREFRDRSPGSETSSFQYHLARLIEMVYAVERIEELLSEPAAVDTRVQADATTNRNEAVGCSEAPRGTLFHHYRVNDDGILTWVNLIIATGQNNLAMNRTLGQIAERYVTGTDLNDEVLNRLEAGIRAFDPCLSCSTHAVGRMPMLVELLGPDGSVLSRRRRNGGQT